MGVDDGEEATGAEPLGKGANRGVEAGERVGRRKVGDAAVDDSVGFALEHGEREHGVELPGGEARDDVGKRVVGGATRSDATGAGVDLDPREARGGEQAAEREEFLAGRAAERQDLGVARQVAGETGEEFGVAVFGGGRRGLVDGKRVPQPGPDDRTPGRAGERPGESSGRREKVADVSDLAGLALPRLEAAVRLVDDVGAATATDHPAIAVARLERLQGIADLHGRERLLEWSN